MGRSLLFNERWLKREECAECVLKLSKFSFDELSIKGPVKIEFHTGIVNDRTHFVERLEAKFRVELHGSHRLAH